MYLKYYKAVVTLMCLCFHGHLDAGDHLHISLGDNYGKHAMLIDGQPAGIQKDILDWFLKEYMHLEIDIESMPWKRAQILVEKTKKSDGYFTTYTKTRVNDLNLLASNKPFYITSVKMHTWKGNPKIRVLRQLKSIDDLLKRHDIRHVFLGGSGYHEEQFKHAKSTYRLNNIHQIAKFLLIKQRADVFIEQSELFYPVADELGLTDKIETLSNIIFKRLYWHLYISKDSHHAGLMQDIDQAHDRAIADGSLLAKVKAIFVKYGLSYMEDIKSRQ